REARRATRNESLARTQNMVDNGWKGVLDMRIEPVNPEESYVKLVAGRPLYAHAVKAIDAGLVSLSGQVPRDANGNNVGPGDMEAQIRQVYANIETVLRACGSSLDRLVRTTTYTTDIDEYFKFAHVRGECLNGVLTTSSAIGVTRLSDPAF